MCLRGKEGACAVRLFGVCVCVCTHVRSHVCMRYHARVCKRCLAALICLQVCVCLSAHTHIPLLPTNEQHIDTIKHAHTLFLSDTDSLSLFHSLSLCRAHTYTHTQVKPPRLGGATKGVFANRAPHRFFFGSQTP